MPITADVILAATVSAANSKEFGVQSPGSVSVFCFGLAGAETATLQVSLDGGSTFTSLSDADGPIQLTATKNSLNVVAPGIYRLAKSATVGAVAISVVS